jgi:type II secretory ATPase GspE/PulE/Tfp pilus assembly ATPase PilB-like protein
MNAPLKLPRNEGAAESANAANPAGDLASLSLLSCTGDYAASAEERKFLCMLSDGRLLVADGHAMNPHVLAYKARLDRMGMRYHVSIVQIEAINRLYQDIRSDDLVRSAHTQMQITAKDLIERACQARASDIHIRVKKLGTEIYFRIHNDLVRICGETREQGERLLATLYGAMTAVSDSSYKPTERQDASIGDRDKLPANLFGVRIATAPTSEGNLMVLRLLYNDAGGDNDVTRLGYTVEHAATLQVLKDAPTGMNIISGPTGSGKSTTLQRVLAGALAESDYKLHVITVEDPVEYPIPGAVQTPVTNANTEDERSRLFSAAIASAMRLDPDTIMIGEVRDKASAQNALRASMTGHQVWTTVHANSAVGIVDRLVDLGLPLNMVADPGVVTGLISQRLVKTLCPHCKKRLAEHRDELPEPVAARVHHAIGPASDACIVGPGCEHCRHQGTVGRCVVAEIIRPDARFFEFIRAGDKLKAIDYWRTELGGRTVIEHAIEKVAAGLVDPRMAEKVVGPLVVEPAFSAHSFDTHSFTAHGETHAA